MSRLLLYRSQLFGILRKEFIEVSRDKFALFMILFVPVLQIYLFTLAIETNATDIRTVVIDDDRSSESQHLVSRLVNTGYFDVIGYVDDKLSLERHIVRGDARVGVLIPAGYGKQMLSGHPVAVLAYIDGSDATIAAQTSLALKALSAEMDASRTFRRPVFEFRTQVAFNPGMDSDTFIVPGLIVILIQKIAIMMTAFSVVREKSEGTLDQIRLAVDSTVVFVAGKITPYFVLLSVIFLVLFAIMVLGFEVTVSGSMSFLLFSSLLFVLLCLALGILVSLNATTHAQAMQLSYVVLMPSILLSGFVFPRELMPVPLQLVSLLLPATHFMEIFRGTVLRGGDWQTLWMFDAWLLTMLLVSLGLIVRSRGMVER